MITARINLITHPGAKPCYVELLSVLSPPTVAVTAAIALRRDADLGVRMIDHSGQARLVDIDFMGSRPR